MDYIIDEIGGVHGCGLGWKPNGQFCGECSKETCIGCRVADEVD